NLQRDPLEEYALAKPASCAQYDNGSGTPADEAWHFCKLRAVIETESFLAAGWDPAPGSPPAGAGGRGRGAGAGAGARGAGPRGGGARGAGAAGGFRGRVGGAGDGPRGGGAN